jgi:hypothetical protein
VTKKISGLGLAALLVGLAVSGCGDTTEVVKTVTVERPAAPDRSPQPTRPEPGRSQRHAPNPALTAPAFIHCDPNIQVKASTTTCGFAENVFWHYWTSGESGSLQVWSPATQSTFGTMCQSDGEQIVCTTSQDGVVKFPQAAVDLYSQTQADAYASSHDLGPDPYEGLPPTASTRNDGGGSGGQDCQGYDPCITPGADVDCAGGTGDGPRYVDGPIYVDGPDPYGLDSNYDGVGCEWG